MRRVLLYFGIAAAGPVAVGGAQTVAPAPPRQATSSWSIVRDADGEELSRTLINRTFSFGFRYINTRPTDLLFAQEVRTTLKRSEEGDNGRVKIDAWASIRPDTGYGRKLWSVEVKGSAARLLDDYYEVTASGCCGAWTTRTYLSLSTGRQVAVFTNGPVEIRGGEVGEPSSQQPLSIVYLSSLGAGTSRALQADSLAFGEIVFLEGDSVLSRVVLSGITRAADPMATAEFAIMSGNDSVSQGSLYVAQGQRAVVRIHSDAWAPIVIPIREKALTLAGVSVPPNVRARLSK